MDEPILDERERILVERYAVDWQMGGTDLASPATLAICARLAWLERRCEQSEAALAELRGEVVVLREAVEFITATSDNISYFLDPGTYYGDSVREAAEMGHAALTATPTTAALGALVEAALSLTLSYDRWKKRDEGDLPAVWDQLLYGLEGLTAAADAVLAAMGKEGA